MPDEGAVDRLFSDLRVRFDAFRTLKSKLALDLGSDFNVFKYIMGRDEARRDELRRREVRLSRIIKDLLDPRGAHGQRDVFLKEFLKVLSYPERSDTQTARVQCEAPTYFAKRQNRR